MYTLYLGIQCDNLSAPSNGGMLCSSGRVGVGYEGDTCSFRCNTGYELIGSGTRTCQNNGSWNGTTSVCRKGAGFCVYLIFLCCIHCAVLFYYWWNRSSAQMIDH